MANWLFTLLVGLAVLVWGGGTVINDKWLAWSKKSLKLIALVSVIIGAFLVYISITMM